jgi:hypothetical protein
MVKEINFEKIPIDLHYVTEMYAQPFQEFDMYYMEEDNSSSSNNKDGGIRDSKVTISTHENVKKQAENNGNKVDFGKKFSLLMKRFFTWLANAKQKFIELFSRNFSAQINYVKKNEESGFNEEIKKAIADGSFKPNVENIPMFKIPLKKLTDHAKHIPDRLKIYHDNGWEYTVDPTIEIVRAAIYPDEVIAYDDTTTPKKKQEEVVSNSYIYNKNDIDYWAMEATDTTNGNESNNDKEAEEKRKKQLQEYFLFGEVTPEGLSADSHYTNELTDNVWKDLCGNILNAQEAIKIGITGICDSLKNEAGALNKKIDDLNNKAAENTANQSENNGENSTNDKASEKNDLLLKRCESMSQSLIKVSNEYAVGLANTMQEMFFKKCYNLYKDIVTEYKNVKDTFNQQQPDQQTQEKNQAEVQADNLEQTTESALVDISGDYDFFLESSDDEYIYKKLDGLFIEGAKISVDSSKSKNILQRIIEFCKKLLNKIIAWIQNMLSKLGFKFA